MSAIPKFTKLDGARSRLNAIVPDAVDRRPQKWLDYVSASELDTTERNFDDELVEGVIGRATLAVIYGDSNSGKTFLAIDLAGHIATGESWFGRNVVSGIVLYLATEAPASVENRIAAYRRTFGTDARLLIVVRSPINLYDGSVDTDAVLRTVKAVESEFNEKVVLIIGDTLARMSAGANENSGEDMGIVLRNADAIRSEACAAFLLIHHAGKDAARGMRGWSGMRAAIDTEIEVTVDESTRVHTAEVTKQRDLGGKGQRLGFRLDVMILGANRWGNPRSTCTVVPTDAPPKPAKGKRPSEIAGAVQVYLSQRGTGMKLADLARALSTAPYTWTYGGVRNQISAMVRDGRLIEVVGVIALPGKSGPAA